MKTTLTEVTPAMAAEMLTHNRANRNLRTGKVNEYARIILNGDWQTTHQGIAFNQDGELIDGQHRLSAIVKAAQPVCMLVTTDVPNGTYAIDAGLRRTTADQIKLGPVKDLPAGLDALPLVTAAKTTLRNAVPGYMGTLPSTAVVVEFITEHANAFYALKRIAISTAKVPRVSTGATYAALLLILINRPGDEADVAYFYDVLRSGMAASTKDAPIVALRNWMVQGGSRLKGSLAQRDIILRVHYAYKKYLAGTGSRTCKAPEELIYKYPPRTKAEAPNKDK